MQIHVHQLGLFERNRNPRTRATAVELLGHDFLKPVAAAVRSPGSTVASPVDRRAPVRVPFTQLRSLCGDTALHHHHIAASIYLK